VDISFTIMASLCILKNILNDSNKVTRVESSSNYPGFVSSYHHSCAVRISLFYKGIMASKHLSTAFKRLVENFTNSDFSESCGDLNPLSGEVDASFAQIQFRNRSDLLLGSLMKVGNTTKSTTLGGFLVADGEFYVLAAAHNFKESVSLPLDTMDDANGSSSATLDFKIDDDPMSDFEEDEIQFEPLDSATTIASFEREAESAASSENQSNFTVQLPVKGIVNQHPCGNSHGNIWECGNWMLNSLSVT
jgi:hypothetical protein